MHNNICYYDWGLPSCAKITATTKIMSLYNRRYYAIYIYKISIPYNERTQNFPKRYASKNLMWTKHQWNLLLSENICWYTLETDSVWVLFYISELSLTASFNSTFLKDAISFNTDFCRNLLGNNISIILFTEKTLFLGRRCIIHVCDIMTLIMSLMRANIFNSSLYWCNKGNSC